MNEFETETHIDRPVADVFAALLDFDKMPQWSPGLTEVRLTGPGPLGVGTTLVYIGKFLGRDYESPAECTEYVVNKKWTTKTTAGPFHLEIENNFEAADDGTNLRAVYRGESRGFYKLAEPVVVRLAKKHFETAVENFKALVEAGAL
jgi:uncharacterized protein YndB with AHSA1/START domain